MFNSLPHKKDEAIALDANQVEKLPFKRIKEEQIELLVSSVETLCKKTSEKSYKKSLIFDWLKIEFNIENPSQALLSFEKIDSDQFVLEVKKNRSEKSPLTSIQLKAIRDEFSNSIESLVATINDIQKLENKVSWIVHEAYGLTAEDLDLMQKTAPPRMPSFGTGK